MKTRIENYELKKSEIATGEAVQLAVEMRREVYDTVNEYYNTESIFQTVGIFTDPGLLFEAEQNLWWKLRNFKKEIEEHEDDTVTTSIKVVEESFSMNEAERLALPDYW